MPSQSASIQKSLTVSEHPNTATKPLTRPSTPSVCQKRKRKSVFRRSLVGDLIVISLGLGLINYLLFRSDPFWFKTNPTPILLLPILIGGRYGSGAGLFTGLLTSAAAFGLFNHLGTAPAALLELHPTALVSFPIIGLLCGEIHSFFNAKTIALADRCEELEFASSRSSADLELYADSNLALQRRLAVHGVRFTSLDTELRRLLAPSENSLHSDTLALLNRVSEISEAAIYSIGKKNVLTREALIGNGDELPETLRADKVEIIEQAIAERQMVTCRDLWGDTPQLFSRHLAAIPEIDPHGEVRAILVIRRLPFHCINWQHFAQIETICAWVSVYGNARDAELTDAENSFEKTAELCISTHNRHALPSVAVRLEPGDEQQISQKKLEQIIAPHLRSTDLYQAIEGEKPAVAVLLPMEGKAGAEQVVNSIGADLKATYVETESTDSTEQFMEKLTGK